MPKRVAFVVDGFNLYHSLDTIRRMTGQSTKWLDLHRLCRDLLPAIRKEVGEKVDVASVHYFSALAEHLVARKPDVVKRHRTYIRALESTGVQVVLSQFKRKEVTCPHCGKRFDRHEEKETDVAIGVKLIDAFARDECDVAFIVSGDTDLGPAIRTARGLFPQRKVGIGFPFLRHNAELEQIAGFSIKIGQKLVRHAQFPVQLTLPDGSTIQKPAGW